MTKDAQSIVDHSGCGALLVNVEWPTTNGLPAWAEAAAEIDFSKLAG